MSDIPDLTEAKWQASEFPSSMLRFLEGKGSAPASSHTLEFVEAGSSMSLNTYGVSSCCNGVIKLGEADTDLEVLRERMAASEAECRACSMFPCM